MAIIIACTPLIVLASVWIVKQRCKAVTITAWLLQTIPLVLPEPYTFNPQRWIDDACRVHGDLRKVSHFWLWPSVMVNMSRIRRSSSTRLLFCVISAFRRVLQQRLMRLHSKYICCSI
ncbi:hypothetical protein EV424DRAFT_1371992 [Suillus variegatus]|nr:hypothetical protein EV424DRAFT_1371992 [Suillus variegatus]